MPMQRTAVSALIASSFLGAAAFGQCGACPKAQAEEPAMAVFKAGHVTERAGEKDIVDTALNAGSFRTLCAAIQAAGLVEALKGDGPFTVFAPTDEAFAKLPKGTLDSLLLPENKGKLAAILKYHVVKGDVRADKVVGLSNATTLLGQRVDIALNESRVMIDKATVTKTDIGCTNGVIHVIDTVLMPATDDVVTTAVKAGSFKTLAAALTAAGLVDVLKGEGPFTVFAPTDEAFAKLPKGTLESLLKPENKEKLVAILKYHVVAGRVYSDQAIKLPGAKTLEGQSFKISKGDKGWRVDDANLIKLDIESSNGVIHVLDSVILPQ